MLAEDFSGVAPALITAAECDVLRSDGVRYHEALQAAGVESEYVLYPGVIHGFFSMAPDVDLAVEAQQHVAKTLKKAFGG